MTCTTCGTILNIYWHNFLRQADKTRELVSHPRHEPMPKCFYTMKRIANRNVVLLLHYKNRMSQKYLEMFLLTEYSNM